MEGRDPAAVWGGRGGFLDGLRGAPAGKGHRYLLEAFARLLPKYPFLHLALVGDGPLEGMLWEQAKRLGVAQRVDFLGWREDLFSLASTPLSLVIIFSATDLVCYRLPDAWDWLEEYFAEIERLNREGEVLRIGGFEVLPTDRRDRCSTVTSCCGILSTTSSSWGCRNRKDYRPLRPSLLWPFFFGSIGTLLLIKGFLCWRQRELRRTVQLTSYTIGCRRRPERAYFFFSLGLLSWMVALGSTIISQAVSCERLYQEWTDRLMTQGGLIFWAYPEVRDFPVHRFGPFTITERTEPGGLSFLKETVGYTGFGILALDNQKTLHRLGSLWDQLLLAYLKGERLKPVWGISEIGYHGSDQKRLDQVVNLLWVESKSEKALYEALRRGHFYTRLGPLEPPIVDLAPFEVQLENRRAMMGETITAPRATQGKVVLDFLTSSETPIERDLVRSGHLWPPISLQEPKRLEYSFTLSSSGDFFRLVLTRPHLLSPIRPSCALGRCRSALAAWPSPPSLPSIF